MKLSLLPHRFDPSGRAVLVTGCSAGIGRASAVTLAQQGFTVFATVRKPADAEGLSALNLTNLVPVCPFDLTRPEQISDAAGFVLSELDRRGINGLYALVNNAGGGSISPLEMMDVTEFRAELETRLVGPVELTQAFLPHLRCAQGRIVWIATPALMPIPYVGSIHICDFAANCLARTLDLELKPWGIPNILIRCGGIKTRSAQVSMSALETRLKEAGGERMAYYAAALQKEYRELSEFDRKRAEPAEVAKVIYRALSAAHPRPRYQVGYLSGAAAVLELLPQTWADGIMAKRSA